MEDDLLSREHALQQYVHHLSTNPTGSAKQIGVRGQTQTPPAYLYARECGPPKKQQQGMVYAAPAADGASGPPRRGRHQVQRSPEGNQGHPFQGHGDDEEQDADTGTTAPTSSEDPCPCSYHLYHGLTTYPLEEIRLPAAQVGCAPIELSGVVDDVLYWCGPAACTDQRQVCVE